MRSGHLRKAIFKPLNFLIFLAALVLAGFSGMGAFAYGLSLTYTVAPAVLAVVGASAGMASVSRTLKSKAFIQECRQADRLDDLQRLSWECNDLFREVSGRVDRNTRTRMRGVLKQKEELIRYFKSRREDPVRQAIVEQALKLVIAFFNLASSSSIRSREISAQNVKPIEQRINVNNRRLGSLKSYEAVLDLTKTIEMDEKLLRSIREEAQELERVSVRLNYIESAINAFKHRIVSTDNSDPGVEEIESIINEAAALDSVLSERKKIRL